MPEHTQSRRTRGCGVPARQAGSSRIRAAARKRWQDHPRRRRQDDHPEREQERVEGLDADRPEDDPETRPAVVVRTSPMPAGDLVATGGRRSAAASALASDERPHVLALGRSPHQPGAHDHPVGARGGGRPACSGVPIPKPSATGTSRAALRARRARGAGVELGALARRPGHRHGVDEAAGLGADARQALLRCGRRNQRDERDPAASHAARAAGASSSGRSGMIRPLPPASAM